MAAAYPKMEQALETVLAAVKRADLTDEEINEKNPYDATTRHNASKKIGWKNGARHVRDLLHGEGMG